MAADEKFENAAEKLGGQAKEGLGKLSGDKETEAEGTVQKLGAEAKQKLQDVKDAAKGAVKGLRGDGDR